MKFLAVLVRVNTFQNSILMLRMSHSSSIVVWQTIYTSMTSYIQTEFYLEDCLGNKTKGCHCVSGDKRKVVGQLF